MREIKFRAWDKDEEEMLYSNQEYYDYDFRCDEHGNLLCYSNCSYFDTFGDEHDEWVKLDNVMQFTGLRDSKRTEEFPEGQEIYEGDIVDHYATMGYVIFEDGMFSLSSSAKVCFGQFRQPMSYINTSECEVIGNIHDNPELLKGGTSNGTL